MGVARRTSVALAATAIALLALSCGANTAPPGGVGPIASVSISGDSLRRLADNAALWPVKQSAERACNGGFGSFCGLGRKVKVEIWADTGARNRHANPTSSGATLVGKFVNTGGYTERGYNLTHGPYDFLLFVYPTPGGSGGRWVVERVSKVANPNGSYDHEPVSQGRYVGCGHDTVTWSKSFGDFRTCADGPPNPPPAGVTRLSAHPGAGVNTAGFAFLGFLKKIYLLAAAPGDPAWFTCKAGCCVADPM